MYLTRVSLDLTKRKTLKAFSAPNMIHGAVEASVAGERRRNLWRIDRLNGAYYLLLLSEIVPDVESLREQFGTDELSETKDYKSLLDRIQTGDTWKFRLTANPTNSLKREDGTRGKVVAHIGIGNQKKWLIGKSLNNGFCLDPESFNVVGSHWYSFRKKEKGERITMLSVTYEGILKITDLELFKRALTVGIGREKAYGMGLLTIAGRSSGA